MLLCISITCILCALASASPAPQAPDAEAEKKCNADTLLRCFSASLSVASTYCSSILPPRSTTTITTTTKIISSITKTKTVTETYDTQTSYVSVPPSKVKRDAATTPAKTPVGPACVTKTGPGETPYPKTRILSACSCIGVTTNEGHPVTTVATQTITSAATFTTTETDYDEASTTTTVTCGEADIPKRGAYQRYYFGSGFDEDDNNPANQNPKHHSDPEEYPAKAPVCEALSSCAAFARVKPLYRSWALLQLRAKYLCKIYYDELRTAQYWTIKNNSVIRAWGYSY